MPDLKKRHITSACVSCGKGLGEYAPTFYEIRVEQHLIDINTAKRRLGLQLMLGGNEMLADVFSPDEPLTKGLGEHRYLVCLQCALTRSDLFPFLMDKAAEELAEQYELADGEEE